MARAVLILAFAAACGGDSTTAPKVTANGTWVLKTINGSTLPFLLGLAASGQPIIVTADTLIVHPDATYQDIAHFKDKIDYSATYWSEIESGTYTFAAATGTITLSPSEVGASPYTGTLHDSTITEVGPQLTWLYVRR